MTLKSVLYYFPFFFFRLSITISRLLYLINVCADLDGVSIVRLPTTDL